MRSIPVEKVIQLFQPVWNYYILCAPLFQNTLLLYAYNTGEISAYSDNSVNTNVGGIAGTIGGTNYIISNCYNTGSVASSKYVGGIGGYWNGLGSGVKNSSG